MDPLSEVARRGHEGIGECHDPHMQSTIITIIRYVFWQWFKLFGLGSDRVARLEGTPLTTRLLDIDKCEILIPFFSPTFDQCAHQSKLIDTINGSTTFTLIPKDTMNGKRLHRADVGFIQVANLARAFSGSNKRCWFFGQRFVVFLCRFRIDFPLG